MREAKVYNVIRNYILKHGYAPSVRDERYEAIGTGASDSELVVRHIKKEGV